MLCLAPYREGVAEYGCGQCLPCRLNRRRLWTSRLLLEQRLHSESCFVTLTYSMEHLPQDGSVDPRTLSLFLKRLRRRCEPREIRFYGVGEYGDHSGRPHYHLALYGLGVGDHISPAWQKIYKRACTCYVCLSWGQGGADVGTLTEASAAYIVSYVTKGCTKVDDERLKGRRPEFARMSLRPGIGAGAAEVIARGVAKSVGWDVYLGQGDGDVPSNIRYEKKLWPLGRYIRSKVREQAGMGSGAPTGVVERRGKELQAELRSEGERAKREAKRVNAARRSRVLDEISRSKKGKGI